MNRPVRELSLKYYADINPSTDEFKTMPEGEQVAFLSLENIWAFGTADYSRSRLWKKSETSYTQFRRGDVLVPKVTPTVFHGRSMVAEPKTEVGLATSEVHVLRPKDGVDRRWIAYNVLSSQFLDRARGNVYGVGGLQRISAGYLGDYKVLETDIASQRRIADYLDRETAEIDAAVADLDRYVELLEKRRVHFISEILGRDQFPAVPLFTLASFTAGEGITADSIEDSGTYPVYGGNGLRGYTETFNQSIDRLLIGRQGALCGNIHYAPGPLFASEHALVVAPRKSVNLTWLEHALRDLNLRTLSQASAQPGISAGEVSRQRVHLPPRETQDAIAEVISNEVGQTDQLIAESTKLRDLLLKRRSVLITEVVTGRKQV